MGRLHGYKDPRPSIFSFGRSRSDNGVCDVVIKCDHGYEAQLYGMRISEEDLERLGSAMNDVFEFVFEAGIEAGLHMAERGKDEGLVD